MTKRHMTHERVIAVADWLRSKRLWIEENKVELSDVTSHAVAELGFELADSSVSALAKSVGIKFKRAAIAPPIRDDRIDLLAQAVAELFDRLGEPRPPALAELLDNHTRNRLAS